MKKSFSFFRNEECEYFPCHKVKDGSDFNCMFCYCPLYLFEDCGGTYSFTDKGVKDCSDCMIPHKAENYKFIVDKLKK